MRLVLASVLVALVSVVVARENTAEVCTGALSCDAGYCCSSSVLDKQELPRVISYEELGQSTVADLMKRLMQEGSHVTIDDTREHISLETLLKKGVAEREKMLASMPQHEVAAPKPANSTTTTTTSPTKVPDDSMNTKSGSATHKNSASASRTTTGFTALVVSVVYFGASAFFA
ncbi:hypothetical protein BG004_003317 [Podila humilis]|nr:hypothetical protein BG004_003317 [Podila humilis]